VSGRWFSPGTPVSPTNKTDRHDITEILLNVSLNTINQAMANTTSYDHYDSKRTLDQGRSSQ
jgi:hypothetical protein